MDPAIEGFPRDGFFTAVTSRKWSTNSAVKNFGQMWRRLAKFSRDLLSMPASSESSERSFSLAGNTGCSTLTTVA